MRQSACFDDTAYNEEARLAYAERFIAQAAKEGFLEQTQGWHVARTYGLTRDQVREIKKKYRNELSFGEGK